MRIFCLLTICCVLAGCERLGIPDPAREAAAREAEGRAIGGACRHAARALEDCYVLNPHAEKAAVFAGWREMNDYMTENKLEAVKPQISPEVMKAASNAEEEGKKLEREKERAAKSAKAAEKGGDSSVESVDSREARLKARRDARERRLAKLRALQAQLPDTPAESSTTPPPGEPDSSH